MVPIIGSWWSVAMWPPHCSPQMFVTHISTDWGLIWALMLTTAQPQAGKSSAVFSLRLVGREETHCTHQQEISPLLERKFFFHVVMTFQMYSSVCMHVFILTTQKDQIDYMQSFSVQARSTVVSILLISVWPCCILSVALESECKLYASTVINLVSPVATLCSL